MSKIIDISTYVPLESDKFFFDANVWMYLYCPIGNYKKHIIDKYSKFLKKAIQSKSSIFISSLMLSEFFNAWIRLEFNILKNTQSLEYVDFKKDFRRKDVYKKSADIAKTVIIEKIMKLAKRIDDKFENISLDDLFKEIEISDFNDSYYLSMANLENFKIVTNDSDFFSSKDKSVPILTANNKLLKNI